MPRSIEEYNVKDSAQRAEVLMEEIKEFGF
jgi:hypothetical protein